MSGRQAVGPGVAIAVQPRRRQTCAACAVHVEQRIVADVQHVLFDARAPAGFVEDRRRWLGLAEFACSHAVDEQMAQANAAEVPRFRWTD